jgi:beta-lactamase regulating signal transducer with metallopeptidase domain
MVATTFSQFTDTDTATSAAWQLTLTLMHVLWAGTAIVVFAAIVDRVIAQRRPTATQTVDQPQNARARYWVNMVALLMVGAALPCTFAVVRSAESTAAQLDNHNTPVVDDRTLTDATVIVTNFEKVSHQLLPSESRDDVTSSTALTGDSAEGKQSILAIVAGRARVAAPSIAFIYLTGVLLMFIRLAAAICGGQRLTSLGHPVSEQSVLDVLAAQAERLALITAPAVAYCERVAVPVVVGVLKPVILLPAAMMSGLSSQELSAVLAHELAHVKRFDHVLIVVQRFLEALLFFHPGVWWLSRRINDSREHACDDLVIQGGTDRLDYARSLLRVAELRVGDDARAGQLAQLAVDGGDPSKLRKRIERIVQSGDEPGVRLNQSRATFALVVTALAIAISIVPVIPNVSEKPVDAAAAPFNQATNQPTEDLPAGEELTYKCDVTDEKTGEPIAGAEVLWRVRKTSFKLDETPLFEQRCTTDSNERYRVTLPREVFEFAQMTTEFEALHPDYLPKKRVGTRLTLPNAPLPQWYDLRHLKLQRGVPVTGRFIEPDGSPAANLVLLISVNRERAAQGYPGGVGCKTDHDGRFRVMTSPRLPKRLHWFPENFVSDSVVLKKETDTAESITFGDVGTIRLKTGPRLSGRVLDQSRKPMEGVILQASTGTRLPTRYATSNAEGQFTFTPLPPARYRVSTPNRFYDPLVDDMRMQYQRLVRPFDSVSVTLPEIGTPEPITIRQAESDILTVIAYDEHDKPAENKAFWAGKEPYSWTISEPVPGEPGKYRLWVRRGPSAGAVTAGRGATSATVWQRTVDSPAAPGAGLSLALVKRNGGQMVVRFLRSGTIRLVVKAGDRIVPWDARLLNVKYAQAAKFEKLGVHDPGFLITVPKQGPEHVIQRVAPNEDVIIDVGIKGEFRKQQMVVRVDSGETKTITIDLAEGTSQAAATNSTSPKDDPKEDVAPKADESRFAALTVKYDVADGDAEATIILENTGVPNGEIGNKQEGMMRYTPVKHGESMLLNKLVPGDYQVARYREVEIITLVGRENDPKGPRDAFAKVE